MAQNPTSPEEWQECVNLCELYLRVDSARQYGLITGGPQVDVRRCEWLLRWGKRRGFMPEPETVKRMLADLVRGA